MYKDKDKQREANRKAQAKFKAKGITEGITNQGITSQVKVIPKRGKDIKCLSTIDGSMPESYYAKHKAVVKGLPGDEDYNGICTPEWIKERRGAASQST